MQIKSRIKSRTQYSVKGERIFPSQVMEGDVNRSIQLLAIRQKEGQKDGQGNIGFVPQHHPYDFSRNHRQSAEIGYQRCHTARPSQDFTRFSEAIESEKTCEFGRKLSTRVDHPSQRYSEAKDFDSLSKFSEDDQPLPAFIHTKNHQNKTFEALSFPFQQSHFDKINLTTTLKCVQQQKPKPDNEESLMDRIYKKLYNQYKNLYQIAQKDNEQLMARFRKVDHLVEELERQKGKMQEELRERSKQKRRVEELEEKIGGLEDTIRTNRRINDALMRKEKEYERRVKDSEERQIGKIEEINRLKQEMEVLNKQCERLKQENIHLDTENMRLNSENIRISQLYEQLTNDFDQHPKRQAFLELSSQLDKTTADNCFLQQSNQQQHITLLQITEHLNLSHEKIAWLEHLHGQLQHNLMETQKELIRVGLQFVNYKLNLSYQDQQRQEQSSVPLLKQCEQCEKLQQSQANTNHIISSDSEDEKPINNPLQSPQTLSQPQNDQDQPQNQPVYSIS